MDICRDEGDTYPASVNLTFDSYDTSAMSWTLEKLDGDPDAFILNDGTVILGAGGGRYRITAQSTEAGCSDSMILNVIKVDIVEEEVFKCTYNATTESLHLKSDSYSPLGYVWTVDPPQGLSSSVVGDSFTYDPGRSTPGTYIVKAASFTQYDCFNIATINIVETDNIEASATVADNSPQLFDGHKTDFGDPCAAASPGQSLIIFYDDVVDANFQVQDFDVTLKANVLPTCVTANQLGESWAKVEGPSSGSLNQTDTFEVKYQNPKVGGLYKFEFDLGVSGSPKSGANVDLPLAGADMTAWLDAETKAVGAWAAGHRTATDTDNYSPIPGVTFYNVYKTWCILSAFRFDYVLEPVDAQQHAPCMRFFDNQRIYSYVTVNGVVVDGSKINNMMWALFGSYWGFDEISIRMGAHLNQVARTRLLDGATSQNAIRFGFDIHDNPSANIATILTPANMRSLQDSTSLIEEKLWPSLNPADTGNSTLTRPTLPTTP